MFVFNDTVESLVLILMYVFANACINAYAAFNNNIYLHKIMERIFIFIKSIVQTVSCAIVIAYGMGCQVVCSIPIVYCCQ